MSMMEETTSSVFLKSSSTWEATWFMETAISFMDELVDEADMKSLSMLTLTSSTEFDMVLTESETSLDDLLNASASSATVFIDASISLIELEVSSAACICFLTASAISLEDDSICRDAVETSRDMPNISLTMFCMPSTNLLNHLPSMPIS